MRSVMSHQFSQIPQVHTQRSSFDRSRGYKTTFDAGYLVPFFLDEVIPGDTFNVRSTLFARLQSPPIVPFMDNLFMDTFFFFVPNRLLWTNWEKFNGAQDNPGDSTSFLIPVVSNPGGSGFAVNSLFDYLGIPTGITGITPNALHSRAYSKIYNDWFRDENLINSAHLDTGNGPDTASNYVLQRRGKRHDYFTSCLPWPQKGTAVTIPLGTKAPVQGIGVGSQTYALGPGNFYETAGTGTTSYTNYVAGAGPTPVVGVQEDPNNAGFPGIYADLAVATAATINQLRQAFQIQRMYERDARGGTRYTEIIRAHFGVVSPDARLQRSEYLGGMSQRMQISAVPQLSATGLSGGTTAQGNLAAYGVVGTPAHGFTKGFTEHGVLLGLVNVRADLTYQQGLDRMMSRQTRFDFFWPALAHLGEQAVLNQEIYAAGNGSSGDTLPFGYQERYAEYRYGMSKITGQFRSTYSTPLDVWHAAQKFTSLPTLGQTFIEDTPPIARLVAAGTNTNGAEFLFDSYTSVRCARPMPLYGVPGNIDRF